MQATEGSSSGTGRLLAATKKAVIAAFVVAALRAALMAVKDEYLVSDLVRLGARSLSRNVAEGWVLCLGPAWVVAVAAAWLAGTRARGLGVVAVLAALVGGYLFVSFRLPERPYYAPELESLRGYLAHGAALVAGIVAACVVAPRVALPRSTAWAVAAVALALVPEAAFRLATDRAADAERPPNVILISLDTLRADRLGCYGYEKPTSPEIDRFAQDAFLFTSVFSPQPFTLTAHMSMMTSLYPRAHGVDKGVALSTDVTTLPELLKEQGYATLAVVDHGLWLDPAYGFGRGFDLYHRVSGSAEIKLDRLFRLLDDRTREPFFLFAHFFDVHSDYDLLPYEATPEDMELFAGWYEGDFNGCGEELCASEHLRDLSQRKEPLTGDDLAYVECLYDAGIRSLDRQVGRLFRELEERGLLESSVVLLTADHGEEFFEHGAAMHVQVFDEALHVPFMIRLPGGSAGSSDQIASLVDVMPTLLDLCGLEPQGVQGVSLAPVVRGSALAEARDHVLLDPREGLPLGVRTPRWSMVPTQEGYRAFDVVTDPAQETDLHTEGELPAPVAELHGLLDMEAERLRSFRDGVSPGGTMRETTAEEEDQLRALGYGGE